jgi:hypothetical protein
MGDCDGWIDVAGGHFELSEKVAGSSVGASLSLCKLSVKQIRIR